MKFHILVKIFLCFIIFTTMPALQASAQTNQNTPSLTSNPRQENGTPPSTEQGPSEQCQTRNFGSSGSIHQTRKSLLSLFRSDSAIENALRSEDYSTLVAARNCIELEVDKLITETQNLASQTSNLASEIESGNDQLIFLESQQGDLEIDLESSNIRRKEVQSRISDAKKRLEAGNLTQVQRDEILTLVANLEEEEKFFRTRIDEYSRRIERNLGQIFNLTKTLSESETRLAAARGALPRKSQQLRNAQDLQLRLEDILDEVLTPYRRANQFKTTITLVFGLLVGIVILGVIVAMIQDDKVRQSVFSSDSGLQFVTLFSLVIAIILFGVLGTLEGKELSALLGGLSGYILGRTGLQQERLRDTESQQHQGSAPTR